MALFLFLLSGFAVTAAIFVFVTSIYGAGIGFLSVSLIFLIAGSVFMIIAKRTELKKAKPSKGSNSSDPLMAIVPDAVMKDPSVKRLINQISENPLMTTVAAAGIGMLLARGFMKD